MRAKEGKMLTFFAWAMGFVMVATPLVRSPGQEAVSAAPDKPESAVATPEPPEGTTAEEAKEGESVGVPAETQPQAPVARDLPPVKGPKKSVGVLDLEDRSGFSEEWRLGERIADMVTVALIETDRFVVVERPRIKDILHKRALEGFGKAAKIEATTIGKLIPAQVGISGSVTEYVFEAEGLDLGPEGEGIVTGPVSGEGRVGISLEIFDAATEEVVSYERVETKGTYAGITGGYGDRSYAIGGEHFAETPLGKATQDAVNETAYRIAVRMGDIRWKGSIVLVQTERIYINCGKREGIAPGQKLVVYSKGEELTDPETREVLGAAETRIGTVSVVEVQEKYSLAIVKEGQGFKRGDILRLD
jgi:curli biogenesis system outer membrane secretion channel CsgG